MSNPLWTTSCYVNDRGEDVIDVWYQAQPERLQAKFDARMRHLVAQPREAWTRPYFDMLHGKCKDIGEVRWEYKNVQYRLLGCFSGPMQFTLLLVATESEGRFVPKNACMQAQMRKMEIELKRRKTNVREFE